jgi:DNA processing protein
MGGGGRLNESQTGQGLVDEAEKAAICALLSVAGVGPVALELIRERCGSAKAAVALGAAELARLSGLRSEASEGLRAAPDLGKRGDWLVRKAAQEGIRVIVRGEPDYPRLLDAVQGAPALLYVRGDLRDDALRVAIIGSRAADAYGIGEAKRVAELSVQAGLTVVSGGAEGVDLAAHEHVLKMRGHTIAVVGSGLLNPYPIGHRGLYEAIGRTGALVSEFALDAGGQRQHYPQRNRTVAGLANAIVITRGKKGSGALSTCAAAVRFGRPVFATPGRVDEEEAYAPNSLLSSGEARALVSGTELLTHLGLSAPRSISRPIERPMPELGPTGRALWDALGPSPRHVDDLSAASGTSVSEALAELLTLEMAGLCAALPGKYFARR